MRSIFLTAAVIAGGAAIGIAGSAGTYAAWNNSVAIPGGVVTTGSTTIQLAPQSSGNFGTSAALGQIGSAFPQSGGWTYTTFTVKNVSTKGAVNVLLSSVSSPSSVPSDANNGLYNAVMMYIEPGNCPTTITNITTDPTAMHGHLGSTFTSEPLAADLTVGSTQQVCLAFNLVSGDGLSGQSINFTLNLTGDQILS